MHYTDEFTVCLSPKTENSRVNLEPEFPDSMYLEKGKALSRVLDMSLPFSESHVLLLYSKDIDIFCLKECENQVGHMIAL